MRRSRQVAASPTRSAGEAWSAITDLVADSLDKASAIERAEVEQTLGGIGGVGRMLVAAGVLESQPLVVRAAALDLEITVLSGDKATSLEENLAAVPGAASASDWTVYLPLREPHEQSVRDAAATSSNLSDAQPPAATDTAEKAAASPVNREALERWAAEE